MQPLLTARCGSVPPAATRWRSCWCPEAVRGFAPHQELHGHRPTTYELFDDSFDNRDDSYPLDDGIYSPKAHLSCLVTAPAHSAVWGLRSLADRLTPYWTAASRSLANDQVLVSTLERYPAPACDGFTVSIARSQPVSQVAKSPLGHPCDKSGHRPRPDHRAPDAVGRVVVKAPRSAPIPARSDVPAPIPANVNYVVAQWLQLNKPVTSRGLRQDPSLPSRLQTSPTDVGFWLVAWSTTNEPTKLSPEDTSAHVPRPP